jgi:hypothetical protein
MFNIIRCNYTINDPPLEAKGCIGEAILGYYRGNTLYYVDIIGAIHCITCITNHKKLRTRVPYNLEFQWTSCKTSKILVERISL